MVNASAPKKRKRNNSTSKTPGWQLAKFESKSSPSSLSYDILEEMGVGLLDSEESSSSIASTFALPPPTSLGSDENSNETHYKTDLSKLCHQNSMMSCRAFGISADNSIEIGNSLNESYEARTLRDSLCSMHAESTQRVYSEEHLQKISTIPHQKRSLLGNGVGSGGDITNTSVNANVDHSSSSITGRTGRSPLATVIYNNSFDNSIKGKYSHEQQIQMLSSTMMHTGNFVMDVTPQNQPLSPCLPSTSQAALRKQQQQLYHMQLQKQHQLNDYFILSRRSGKDTAYTANGKDHFSRLSDEMILQVFKWLPKKALLRCGQVSRRFNQCAADETLWTRLDMGGRCIRSGALGHILNRGVVILRLAQSQINHPIFDAKFLESDKNYASKLQFLDLSMATIAKPALKSLLSCCRQLKKLSLEHVPISDEICNEIAANTHLEALNLTMCFGLEAWSVRKMMESLKNLNSLNISWTNLSIEALTSLVTNITSNLLRLNLSGCRKTMFDSHLSTLAKRCPQLLELDLSDCTSLTGNSIGIICKFKMLEYVSLSRCYSIPATSYVDLANSKSLAYLDVFGMLTDAALEMLERSFPTIGINKFIHSSVARPTVGTRRTSIWGLRTRD